MARLRSICAAGPYTFGLLASALCVADHARQARADLADHLRHDTIRLLQQGEQQVQRLDGAVIEALSEALRGKNRLLSFGCKPVQIHRLYL